jgi:2-oxoglutarate ferredoxin oxidoreductase subunit delta
MKHDHVVNTPGSSRTLEHIHDDERAAIAQDQKVQAPESKVLFHLAWCKNCRICVDFCPTHALEMGARDYPYLAYPDKCTECGMCEVRCPDFVITVSNSKLKF